MTRPKFAAGFLVVAFVLTGVALPKLGEEFLPNFKETDFLMHWVEKPGTSLDAMRPITINVSKEHRVKGHVPGHEIEYPMAVVILGGLATSTLLNLFLVPS